jgi:eukaryotic translation initiation factor 2C
MAWNRLKIDDFSIKIQRGKGEVTFSLKNSTTFSLGIIKQYLAKKARTTTVVLEALNFLNHLFSVGPTLSLIPVGRKFFTDSDADIKKFEIIEFRKGLFQAVHFGGDQSLTLNVDITTGVFWNSDFVTALDLACRYLGIRHEEFTVNRVSPQQIHQLSRVFKGLKYRVLHRGDAFSKRQHTIAKVAKKSAKEHTFQMNGDSPQTISVDEYMKKTYNLKLKYPDAILLMKGDSTYLPLELCYIVPVQYSEISDLICSVNATLVH